MSPPGPSAQHGRPAMGRSLAELLESYLDDGAARPVDDHPRRAPTPELRGALDAALRLAAAVAPGSVVGVAYSPDDGSAPIAGAPAAATIVRLGGARVIDRSLALGSRLADDGLPGLADAEAEHLVIRSGDRLRLGVDRGWELDGEQRALLAGIALLTARAVARSGASPLRSGGTPSATSASHPAPGRDPSSELGVEVA